MRRAWPLRLPSAPARPQALEEVGIPGGRPDAVYLEGYDGPAGPHLLKGPGGALLCAPRDRLDEALADLPPRWRADLTSALDAEPAQLRLPRGPLPLGERTYVMGVLNVTPDSFSDGGRYFGVEQALRRAKELESEGADIIDVGGESTRPGAQPLPLDEELRRVVPVLEELRRAVSVPLSIDTYKWPVAERAIALGIEIVNDVTAGLADPALLPGVARSGAAVVLMHTQQDARYARLGEQLRHHLQERLEAALRAGVAEDAIVLDPGIGFAKEPEHSFAALRQLGSLRGLGRPVLFGPSRKRFIGAATGKGPEERLYGTLASLALAVAYGADIVRVHDVAPAVDAVRVADRAVRG